MTVLFVSRLLSEFVTKQSMLILITLKVMGIWDNNNNNSLLVLLTHLAALYYVNIIIKNRSLFIFFN
jgi:hypothetical protein